MATITSKLLEWKKIMEFLLPLCLPSSLSVFSLPLAAPTSSPSVHPLLGPGLYSNDILSIIRENQHFCFIIITLMIQLFSQWNYHPSYYYCEGRNSNSIVAIPTNLQRVCSSTTWNYSVIVTFTHDLTLDLGRNVGSLLYCLSYMRGTLINLK